MNDSLWFFGGILFLVGIIMLLFPPKNINGLYGYRTVGSMKNMKSWNLAQKLGGRGLAGIGLVEFSFALLSLVSQHVFSNDTIYAFGILVIGILGIIFYTENKIKGL